MKKLHPTNYDVIEAAWRQVENCLKECGKKDHVRNGFKKVKNEKGKKHNFNFKHSSGGTPKPPNPEIGIFLIDENGHKRGHNDGNGGISPIALINFTLPENEKEKVNQ